MIAVGTGLIQVLNTRVLLIKNKSLTCSRNHVGLKQTPIYDLGIPGSGPQEAPLVRVWTGGRVDDYESTDEVTFAE